MNRQSRLFKRIAALVGCGLLLQMVGCLQTTDLRMFVESLTREALAAVLL